MKKKIDSSALAYRDFKGPFDIIGDVHGCLQELLSMVRKLGYEQSPRAKKDHGIWFHPQNRRLVFVGDLIDRGPDSVGVLLLVRTWVHQGLALAVRGNHDDKCLRSLKGNKVELKHGLAETLQAIYKLEDNKREQVKDFLSQLPNHLELDKGNLCIVHAGINDKDRGYISGRIRTFCLYGSLTGLKTSMGFPQRIDWTKDRSEQALGLIVYGHSIVTKPYWNNNTVNIDTGCVFGGLLTALRYPECQVLSVPAQRVYVKEAQWNYVD